MVSVSSFNVTYDWDSDVLYISRRRAPASRGVEDKYGIFWRYDSDGELIGVTVIDFYDHWFDRQDDLATEISRRFHVPVPQARIVLQHALDVGRSEE